MSAPQPTTSSSPTASVISTRRPLLQRLAAWSRHTPLNPYWLDTRHLAESVEFLSGHASGVMFDVGVGERPYADVFEGKLKRYLGLEYPPVVFGNLNPQLHDSLHKLIGIIDVWGDGQALPLADACVDTVLSLEVLEHVPDPDACVREMARVLRPGGKALITVPFSAPLHQLPFDFRRFTPRGLTDMLEKHGLELIELRPRGNVATAAGAMLSQYLLRHWAAVRRKHDGSVRMSRWRGPLTLPFIGVTQLLFRFLERMTTDDAQCLGYAVVAQKPKKE